MGRWDTRNSKAFFTETEIKTFLHGYLLGQIEGIVAGKYSGLETPEALKEWKEYSEFSGNAMEVICERLGLSKIVSKEFEISLKELVEKVDDIITDYRFNLENKPKDKITEPSSRSES